MINVAIVDDHPIVREGLKNFLESKGGIRVVAQSDSTEGAKIILKKESADVMILDIGIVGAGGLSVLDYCSKIECDTEILVLSVEPEKIYAERVLKYGAAGYLQKDSDPQEIADSIRQIYRGFSIFKREVLQNKFLKENEEWEERISCLTDKEMTVFRMLVDGKRNKQIASELGNKQGTIGEHRRKILEKLELDSLADLVKFAILHGLD